MTALERMKAIKDIPRAASQYPGDLIGDHNFLLRAFRVMREIAIDFHLADLEALFGQKIHRPDPERHIDQEFEQRMKDAGN